jgi:hypothetical protein
MHADVGETDPRRYGLQHPQEVTRLDRSALLRGEHVPCLLPDVRRPHPVFELGLAVAS